VSGAEDSEQRKEGSKQVAPEVMPVLPPSRLLITLSIAIMSTVSTPTSSTSSPKFDSIFTSAFRAYKKKTGKDITSHPLAAELETCHSPDAVLNVLRAKIPALGRPQSSDEPIEKWLIPTINVLYSFSSALGEGIGLVNIAPLPFMLRISALTSHSQVFSPAKAIFVGIGILLLVSPS